MMKFKKIEISGFRIYDDPKDATFDLTTASDKPAGFISLYAPNGFGKTSFYDAVEYGITGSINRFFVGDRELDKLANFQNQQNELSFIRNIKSPPERETFINITTDSDKEPIISKKFKKHGNQIHDLNFKTKPEVHEFQKVILSQEWITAFLTEQNGEYRYEKFMEIPELSNINEYYKKLKQTCSVHDTKKNKLKEAIEDFEKSIQNIDSENLLDTVNNQIQLLAEKFKEQSLIFLSLESTQEDIKRLKDIIANRTISRNQEAELIKLLEYVDISKSGNDSVMGIKSYFAIQDSNQRNHKRSLEIQTLIEKFESFEKIGTEIESIKKSQQNHINDKNQVTKVISDFLEYERILKEVQEKIRTISQTETSSEDINKQLSELNRTEIELRSQLETVLRQLEELATKKAKIPELKVEIEHLNNLIQKTDKELNDKKGQADKKENKQRELESAITNLLRIIKEITDGVYPQISKDENREISELVQTLKESEQLLSNENTTLKSLNTTLKQQETLNQTILDFIKAGLSIVDERQSSSCPLCEEKYDSYSALVEKITNNKALDETLKTLLAQKSKSELRISDLTTKIKKSREQLLDIYKQQLDGLFTKNQEERQLLESLRLNIKDLEVELNILKEKNEIQKLDLKGLSFEIFEKQIDENIIEANKVRDVVNPKLSTNKEAIDKVKEQLVFLKDQIDLLKKENENLINNEKYVFVTGWFNEYFPDKEINKELLLQRESSLTQSISQLAIQLKETDEKNGALNQELTSFKKENLLQEKLDLGKLIHENDAKLIAYRYFLKDNLDIDSSQMDEKILSNIIEEKQTKYKADLERTRSIQLEYQKLEKYSENVWPFLQSENAKMKLANAIEELDFLEQKVEPVIKIECDNARTYLENRIKNFFHEELINKLYRKIDPHPDFKSVKFKANFDSDHPRLDVFVENTKNENVLIPNLYFSTAQINILSLSIFLATALNSTVYNCIFIDDPIQSMDSVNVLSTIDLLRSIVVNEGKQIVLSTHDENFHNLLKKKMPSELFESKFLELESFGKLKTN
ncbi:hypothetical protein [Chryseobacterium bernardetii]|uniref:hypothetical protein n=1 Tax=Chryseobacterium bernardetii TaxID=1241978 RepID=UPI00162A484C|nr:hypothetical protein [Chryseobacterium bernardetii]